MAEYQSSQQVRIDLVFRVGLRRVWPWYCAFQAHDTHEPLDPLALDLMPIQAQPVGHLPGTKKRGSQILLVNDPHQALLRGARQVYFREPLIKP